MKFLRSKPLLLLALFLAVVLQGLMPFLHAHTGASTQVGIHLHGVNSGVSPVSAEGKRLILPSTSSESPEVGVPASKQNDQFDFDIPDLLSLVLLVIPLLLGFAYRKTLFSADGSLSHRSQSQNSLPPALAPPVSL